MARTIGLILIMALALSGSCTKTDSRSAASNLLQNKPLTEENILEALDKIALTDPDFEDYKREEIASIISSINDPKLLFNLILKLQERIRKIPSDGKSMPCDRYDAAIYLSMERLSNLKTDEAAKYLVKLIEVKAFDGHAHRTETLLHSIASVGQPALPFLKGLKDNYLAQEAIKCIENNDPCH